MRLRTIFIIGVALAALFVGLISTGAWAITYSGGEQWQRDAAREVIESLPGWQTIDQMSGALVGKTGIDVRLETFKGPGTGGSAPGVLYVGLTDHYLYITSVVAHEFSHHIWYVMPDESHQRWLAICPGDNLTWETAPTEHWAECLRVALFDLRFSIGSLPRTTLATPPVEALNLYHQWQPTIAISQPVGSVYQQGHLIYANWTTHPVTTGEFALWIRQLPDTWYFVQTRTATGATSYQQMIQLSVPVGNNYNVIIAYRPVVGSGTWRSWATSPGTFGVCP